MLSNPFSQAAALLQPKQGNRPLSDLSARIRIFHEREDRGSVLAFKEQEMSKEFHALPLPVSLEAFADYREVTASTDWSTKNQVDDDHDDGSNNDNSITTIQRICRNIHRKRDAWQQIALRRRHAADPHLKTLQILKEAAKRAKATATAITEEVTSSSEKSDEPIPAKALLHHVRNNGTPTGQVHEDSQETIDVKIAAVKLQASYRGYITRRHTAFVKRHGLQLKEVTEIAATTNQSLTLQPSHFSLSQLTRPKSVERQCSDITMSDFGDSTHHTPSVGKQRSFRSPSRWIEEGKVVESSDDEDNYDGVVFPASGPLNKATDNHTPKTSVQRRYQLKDSASFLFRNYDIPSEGDCWQWQHHSLSTWPVRMNPTHGDLRNTCAMGHSSYSSYFDKTPPSQHNILFIPDEQSGLSPGQIAIITPSTNYKPPQSGSQGVDDYIESMLEKEEEFENTNEDDDDVSLAASFFEEEPRFDKDSNSLLHRSDGSLDFRSTLKDKSATFRDLKGKIPPSCFHLSLSTSSRWDGGLPDPATVSQLSQHDQKAVAKAAISTYLPVRPPPRKLTPTNFIITTGSGGNSDNNNSLSTVFSSAESTEPSPQMPLRKASTHGSANPFIKSTENELSPQIFIPDPPTCRSDRPAGIVAESSPQLPIRKTSLHHGIHRAQGDRAAFSAEAAHPPTTVDTPSMRRKSSLMSISPPILEDGPIRQPERKSSGLAVVDDDDGPLESQDGVKMNTNLNSPLTVVDDHPIRLPVRKLSSLTLNSTQHSSSQMPPRPPKPSPQVDVSLPKNDGDT